MPIDPSTPFHLRPDTRFPARGTTYTRPIKVYSLDGSVLHTFRMIGANEALETTYINRGKQKRQGPDVQPADIVIGNAMRVGKLTHINDGPRGGIWVVSPDREDVVEALKELPDSKWRVLGLGVSGSEKCVFMIHPCGPSGPDPPMLVGRGGPQFGIKPDKKGGLLRRVGRKIKKALE